MLKWIHTEAFKLMFGVVIGIYNNGSDRRITFVTLRCERSDQCINPLWNFKQDDTG